MIVNNTELLSPLKDHYKGLTTMKKVTAIKILLTLGMLNLTFSPKSDIYQRVGMKVLRILKMNYKTSDNEIQGQLPEDYPVKMHPILANILIQQLRNIVFINEEKRAIVNLYESTFEQFDDLYHYVSEDQVLVRYPILFKDELDNEMIERIKSDLSAEGIQFGDWFNDVVHPKGSYRYCYSMGDCPNGEKIATRMMNLPVNVYQQVSDDTLDIIVQTFRKNGIK
jgi:hypothetical protein